MRISGAERDALYEELYARLSGIDDLWLAAEAKDYERADRVAREFSDDLRLILGDLGWGEGAGEPLELATPPDVLRRVLTRMQEGAEAIQAMEQQERAEIQRREERTQRVLEACRRVLGELDRG